MEEVEDPVLEISLANAKMMDSKYDLGDVVTCADPVQTVWTYRYPECEKCDFAEDPGRRKKGTAVTNIIRRKEKSSPVWYSVIWEEM